MKNGVDTYDKCNICNWVGLSYLVVDNACPLCGSKDMVDIDWDQNIDEEGGEPVYV